jgi:hypothetical protein
VIFHYDWRKFNAKFKYAFKSYVIKPELIFKFSDYDSYRNPVSRQFQTGLDGWINYCLKEADINQYTCITNNPINLINKYV